MQSKLPMHLSPRCGARTRSGSRCQSPAMPNGRCRMHGGMSPGAPKGNKNAFKHGHYTAEAIASRLFSLLANEISQLLCRHVLIVAAVALLAYVAGLTHAARQESLDRLGNLWPLAL